MSIVDLLSPLTGVTGSNGVPGYPYAANGSSGGAAYTSLLGNTVENLTLLTGGTGGTGGASYPGGGGGSAGHGGGGGSGGVGVYLETGPTMLTNVGVIIGGTGGIGGYGDFDGSGGSGGAGVYVLSGTVTNAAVLDGGNGGNGGINGGYGGTGGNGGVGVILFSGTLTNSSGGTITGGNGGNGGNSSKGGEGGNGGNGGAGVDLFSGSTLTSYSAGTVTGGNGGNGGASGYTHAGGNGGSGGAGVDLSGGTFTTSLTIIGGTGGTGGSGGPHGLGLPGGAGGAGGGGGVGVYLTGGGLTISGRISGGSGGSGGNGGTAISGPGPGGVAGNGGAGVYLKGGSLNNSGTITGGSGGIGGNEGQSSGYYTHGGNGGNGGAGVYLNGGTLTTSGTISGGAGGAGGSGHPNGAHGAAGDAVKFGAAASTLVVDPGAVFNGQVAANASANDVLVLAGTQSGGTAITLGTQFTGFSTLDFGHGAQQWTVDVGTGAASHSPGLAIDGFITGDTIDVTNLTPSQVAADFNPKTDVLTSSDGTLHFSVPSDEYFVFNSDGGTGTDVTLAAGDGISTTLTSTVTLGGTAHPSPLTITSTGLVKPTKAGATAVLSQVAGNVLTNQGTIQGAAGSNGTTGGAGGMGVDFKSGLTFNNAGSVTGGTGGSASGAGAGGTGGVGVNLLAGTLANQGTIRGGNGGNGTVGGAQGGVGVILNGGTLITSGTISGGPGGGGGYGKSIADAVKFGTAASTLNVDPGAVFNGLVAANATANDVLELSGVQSGGTAITLGTLFTGFHTLDFATGAAWTVDATKSDLTAHTLTIGGFTLGDRLDITNLPHTGGTASFNSTTDVLTITQGATAIHLQFDSAFSGDHFVLTANGAGTDVTLQSGPTATLAAAGRDLMNFVSAEHRALMNDRLIMSAHPFDFGPTLRSDLTPLAFSGHGLSHDLFTPHASIAVLR